MRAMNLIAFLIVPGAASAGVYMETEHKDLLDTQAKSDKQKMWFDGGNFRAEDSGSTTVQIYKDKTIYILEPADKRYTKLDKASIDSMSTQLADVRKQMEARMATMSPEQRAMVEKMMGDAGVSVGKKSTPQRSVTQTSRTESAAGQTCKVWEVLEDGKKEEELCVVAPGALPGGTEMMATMRELGELFKGFMESVGGASNNNAASNAWRDLQTVNGIPVITRTFDAGKATNEFRLTSVRAEAVPATSFTVPAGFKPRSLDADPGSAPAK